MPARSAKNKDLPLFGKFKARLESKPQDTLIYIGFALIALFLILASLAPDISSKFGLLYLKKQLQKIFAAQTIYYVDTNHPSANDANSGTEANPWKTIQKAANTLAAGGTVYIKAGTYTGRVSPKISASAGAWITYSAYPGQEQKVILNGSAFQIVGKGGD